MNATPPGNDPLPPPFPASDSNPDAAFFAPAIPSRVHDGVPTRMLRWIAAGFLLLLILLALQWWSSRNDARRLRADVAQRLQGADSASAEARLNLKTAQEAVKELQAKVTLLEGRQVETQSQQLALEELYKELSKNRDDWALAEIEQVLSTASQQLQLAGNVQGALIALQNADSRLARNDKPQFIVIRRALARDIDRLKALPTLDLTGIALRLDSIISQIDYLPLLADEKPALPALSPKPSGRAVAPSVKPSAARNFSNQVFDYVQDKWNSWSADMWNEIRQLIRVRSVDTPEALLLSPTEAYYARENLKLRLLNARLALLSRNESAFRSDLVAAQDAISRYFDTRSKQTQTTQALMKQVQSSNLSIEMPTLVDSLNAVRNYKVKP